MTGKITKKELKEPDFLHVEFDKLVRLFLKYKTAACISLAALLVIVVVVTGWYFYNLNYEQSAQDAYNIIEIQTLKSNLTPDLDAGLIEGFQKVVSKYPSSRAALYSSYQLGNLYLNVNQPDQAIKAYDKFIDGTSHSNYLKVFAYIGKGYCHEMKKDFKKAMLSFESALNAPQAEFLKGQIYRDMARVYEELNDQNKSLEYYRKALEETADPTIESIIKRKIAALN